MVEVARCHIKIKRNLMVALLCTYQCKPRGGGGSAGKGWGFDVKSISSVGGLIEYLCSGVGTFDLFGRETGAKIKRGYLASSFLALEWRGFPSRVFYRYLSATS